MDDSHISMYTKNAINKQINLTNDSRKGHRSNDPYINIVNYTPMDNTISQMVDYLEIDNYTPNIRDPNVCHNFINCNKNNRNKSK
ncbi:hypothetical protein PFDG_05259 [Plasmodium falciparum Dd2]|uniref:Uncharacterized protein n=1 Tax=Plasmodium falciparum (isolate Dd2) TaxID=57267 RepID=A0A0L7MAT1_PLAF4|nr:hypothetical protein PFDG_05259 [Plasmodium falciparum Dd2]